MKTIRWLAVFSIIFAANATEVSAQPAQFKAAVESVKAELEPATAQPGQTVNLKLTIKLAPGWHTYPSQQIAVPDSSAVNQFDFRNSDAWKYVSSLKDPSNVVPLTEDPSLQMIEDSAVWERPIVVKPKTAAGDYPVTGRVKVLVCRGPMCLPPQWVEFKSALTVKGTAVPVDPRYAAELDSADSGPTEPPVTKNPVPPVKPPAAVVSSPGHVIVPPAASLEEHVANLEKLKEQLPKQTNERKPLFEFILTAIFWGLVSLVTPCVFPMIPITVSFFLKQSAKEHHQPVRMATIYCLTIVLVLGLAALLLLNLFYFLSRHWITNATIGAIFVVFALSLFGLYEITLPQGLANFTSAREGRGGTLGTVFMALTFTVISFTCVAPFLGGFAGLVDSKKYSWFELALGAFAYSSTFAAPFFFLALFPSMIKKLPKSGSWLNSVKVVMGFLELAAALKFFRTAELRFLDFGTVYFTYDLVLAIWVVLAVVCGLYLLNVFRFDHDTHTENVGVIRVILALAFFSLATYMAPAMLKHASGESQRPRGVAFAWIDSFLLPEPRFTSASDDSELHWSANLKGTVDEARKELLRTGQRQFVFVDHTGVTCTNCQINERNVFSRDDVRKSFREFWLVQQYTDEVRPEFYPQSVEKDRREKEAEANQAFQTDRFGTVQLPLYVVLEVLPDKLILRGTYDEGKINDPTKFLEFLRKSRE